MPSWQRPPAVLSLVSAVIFIPAGVRAEGCDQLWQARNGIFAEAGHCFKSSRAIAVFGRRCYPPYGRLSAAQQARVNSIVAEESRLGCSGSAPPPSGGDAQLPLPGTTQGGNPVDQQFNEAASVWAATKDTSSPAVLEAYISRFGVTPFGDLARARLEEVKKTSAATPPLPPKDAPPTPGETEMCPKYLPSVGRTVQAPCESYQFRAD